jgi:hypothetical protein
MAAIIRDFGLAGQGDIRRVRAMAERAGRFPAPAFDNRSPDR